MENIDQGNTRRAGRQSDTQTPSGKHRDRLESLEQSDLVFYPRRKFRCGEVTNRIERFSAEHDSQLIESFWAGEPCLFYVEGDREFAAEPGMTVAEFAAQNNGSFLVLTVKME